MENTATGHIAKYWWVYLLGIFAIILAFNWKKWFKKNPAPYTLYTINDSFPHEVCYNGSDGLKNCNPINIATNSLTQTRSMGIEGLTYKADLNATRDSVKITLIDKDGHILDTITFPYN